MRLSGLMRRVALALFLAFVALGGSGGLAVADTLQSSVVVPASMSPSLPFAFGGSSYLSVEESSTGRELWKADVQLTTMSLFKDIGDGGPDTIHHGSGSPDTFVASGQTLYFRATDLAHGVELWATDGTVAGTRLVKDIRTGDYGSALWHLTPVAGGVVFRATDDSLRQKLWFSDGTEAGTKILADVRILDDTMVLVGSEVLFIGYETNKADAQIWSTDGTVDGTERITDLASDGRTFPTRVVAALGCRLYLTRGSAEWRPDELWTIDLNGAIARIAEAYADWGVYASIQRPTSAGRYLYFLQADGHSPGRGDLWRTDGTVQGTIKLREFRSNSWLSAPSELAPMGDDLIFAAGTAEFGKELWCTDGTPGGTRLLKDINTTAETTSPKYGSDPHSFREMGERMYFGAYEPAHGTELWQTDGSPGGTALASEAIPGPASLDPRTSTVIGNHLFHLRNVRDPLVRVTLPAPDGSVPRCRETPPASAAASATLTAASGHTSTVVLQAPIGMTKALGVRLSATALSLRATSFPRTAEPCTDPNSCVVAKLISRSLRDELE